MTEQRPEPTLCAYVDSDGEVCDLEADDCVHDPPDDVGNHSFTQRPEPTLAEQPTCESICLCDRGGQCYLDEGHQGLHENDDCQWPEPAPVAEAAEPANARLALEHAVAWLKHATGSQYPEANALFEARLNAFEAAIRAPRDAELEQERGMWRQWYELYCTVVTRLAEAEDERAAALAALREIEAFTARRDFEPKLRHVYLIAERALRPPGAE